MGVAGAPPNRCSGTGVRASTPTDRLGLDSVVAMNDPKATEVTASHWDDYVSQHMVDGSNTNRAEWMSHPVVQRYRQRMMGATSEVERLTDGWLRDRHIQHAVGLGAGHGSFELVTRVRDPLTVSSQGVEDLIGRLVPDEWLRFVVPVVHPRGDG